MKERLLRWLFEALVFEVNREDGSGWGFEYNRAAIGVIGAGGTLLLVCLVRRGKSSSRLSVPDISIHPFNLE